MYTLDTNAIIYYLKNDSHAVDTLEEVVVTGAPVFISTITELELLSLSTLDAKEEKAIEKFLLTLSHIPVDSRIARISAALRRTYLFKTPDSIIAATALFTGSSLLTRNVKDFQKVDNLHVVKT